MSILSNSALGTGECAIKYILGGESDTARAIECVEDEINANSLFLERALTIFFLVYSSSLVFLMQAGFAMICSGCVRKKNVQNTMLKNLLDICGSSIAFYFVGYAFAFGGDPEKRSFIGTSNFLLQDLGDDTTGIGYAHWLFQFAFAATAGKICISLFFFQFSCKTKIPLKADSTFSTHFSFLLSYNCRRYSC